MNRITNQAVFALLGQMAAWSLGILMVEVAGWSVKAGLLAAIVLGRMSLHVELMVLRKLDSKAAGDKPGS